MTVLEAEFLKNDGDPQWLKGLQYVPPKVINLLTINKMLAHQPWFVKPSHMKVHCTCMIQRKFTMNQYMCLGEKDRVDSWLQCEISRYLMVSAVACS